MKKQSKVFAVFSILIVLSMVLAACTTPTAETVVQTVEVPGETVVETQVVEQVVTEVVEVEKIVEVTPTPVPSDRTGAWVDQVVFTSIDEPTRPSASSRPARSTSTPTLSAIPSCTDRPG